LIPNALIRLDELGCVALEAILLDQHALVVAVEQVEGFDCQFHFQALADVEFARKSAIGGGVIGTNRSLLYCGPDWHRPSPSRLAVVRAHGDR
jgi:hypothetical protein